MNAERRKRLSAVYGKLVEAKTDLEAIRDEEQEYYDNMPESLQGGEKGEAASSAVEAMEEIIDGLDNVEGLGDL